MTSCQWIAVRSNVPAVLFRGIELLGAKTETARLQ
jgi:hypothetical protein